MSAQDTTLTHVLLKLLPALDRQVSRELAFALRPLRVTPAQCLIIDLLAAKGKLPPRKISEALELDQSTVVSTLTRMERDKLIQRIEDPADGRSVLICLTDHAEEVADQCRDVVENSLQKFGATMTSAELSQLAELISKLKN